MRKVSSLIKINFAIFLIMVACPKDKYSQIVDLRLDRIYVVNPYCFYQDPLDFLWIGTEDGLLKYDGYEFKSYRQMPFDSTSLSNNSVYDIKGDKIGNLWIGTGGGGLNYFNQKTEIFIHYMNDPNSKNALGGNTIKKIIVDENGSLWLNIFQNGFTNIKWDSLGNPIYTRYMNTEKIPTYLNNTYGLLDIYKDKKGYLWFSGGLGLERLNTITGERKIYKHKPNDSNTIGNNWVSSICEDNSGNLWLATGFYLFSSGNGLDKFNPLTEKFTHYRRDPKNPNSFGSDTLTSIYIDSDNTLWLNVYDKGVQKISLQELTSNPKPNIKYLEYVKYSRGSYFYEDNQKNIWITFLRNYSIRKYNKKQNRFPHVLSKFTVKCIFIDSNENIWFGHFNDGLTKYNTKTSKYMYFKHEPGNINSISENEINAICEDGNGNIWIATPHYGIDILNPSSNKFTHIRENPNDSTALFSNFVEWLLPSKSGNIWTALSYDGLQLFDFDKKQFKRLNVDPNTKEDKVFVCLYEDHSETLWIGTQNNGLYSIDFNNNNLVRSNHFLYNQKDTNSLTSNMVTDIIQPQVYDTSALWIATSNGLNRLDMKTGTFTNLLKNDGIASSYILKILEDNDGNLWFTTAAGLTKYYIKTKRIRNYGINDGLPTTTFITGEPSTIKDRDGKLYFAGNGVIVFDPKEIKDNQFIPPIRLTDFKVFNESVKLDTAVQYKKKIRLSHKQNVFSFEFTALNFTNSKENQYKYKMEGFHDDWINSGKERTASFTNLDPGEYDFRVIGSNNDEVWNEEGTAIKVIILPPWWKTTWAYIGYIILTISLFYSLWRFQLNRYRLKHELELEQEHSSKLKEIDKMRSRFLANISHEFRTPLTLILGPIEKLFSKASDTDSQNDLSMMKRNANRLLRLINQLLDLSKLESGGMRLKAGEENIVQLVHQYIQSFESLAKQKGIELKFKTVNDLICVFVDKDKIEQILNNLLSNAFKFTEEGGIVTVEIRKTDNINKHIIQSAISRSEATRNLSNYKISHPDESGILNDKFSHLEEYVQISVSNTGYGISQERINKIFDRFYQVETSQKQAHEGTGIGLALTKELVELHHGKIEVESKINEVTTFYVYLPLGKDHLKPEEIVEKQTSIEQIEEKLVENNMIEPSEHIFPADEQNKTDDKNPIILIIDDNPDMRSYIRGNIENNFKIIEAENGQKGFNKAAEVIPDLIISDVMMPELDGIEFCEKIRKDERTSHIPVILLTARAEQNDKIEGLKTGADDYLIKPFNAQELQVRINNLIDQRKRIKEKFLKKIIWEPESVPTISIDEKFIHRLNSICNNNLSDSNLSVESLASEIGLSRSQLHRKLKGLTGQSSSEFIKTIRLKRAAQLIKENYDNISQIAYEVGFNNLSYFAKSFKELFGKNPSEY